MPAAKGLVVKEGDWLVVREDEHIDAPVVVEVARGQAAATRGTSKAARPGA